MPLISVRVQNMEAVQYDVTVCDQYNNNAQVTGSPFTLASEGGLSPVFSVVADSARNGMISYSCDAGGPSQIGVRVRNGTTVPF